MGDYIKILGVLENQNRNLSQFWDVLGLLLSKAVKNAYKTYKLDKNY